MKKQFLLLSLIGIFLSTVFAAESFARILDQRSNTPETVSGWAISDRNAQTVTVGVEGYLSHIDLQIFQSDAIASGDVVVDIFGLDSAGAPDVNNLLGSATIGNGMIPTATELGNNFQYTPADFSSQNLHFEVRHHSSANGSFESRNTSVDPVEQQFRYRQLYSRHLLS